MWGKGNNLAQPTDKSHKTKISSWQIDKWVYFPKTHDIQSLGFATILTCPLTWAYVANYSMLAESVHWTKWFYCMRAWVLGHLKPFGHMLPFVTKLHQTRQRQQNKGDGIIWYGIGKVGEKRKNRKVGGWKLIIPLQRVSWFFKSFALYGTQYI